MKEYKLGDIVTFNYGKSLPKTKRVDGSVPVMSSAGITGWHNKAIIEGPGVIVGRKGSIGTVFYEKRDFYPIDTCYFVTVNDPEILDLKFTYYLLLGSNLKDLNSDAAVPGLNREIAYSQKFKIPSKNVQLKIVKLVDDYNNLIENNNRRIAILEDMAQSLYREWFVNFRYPGHVDAVDASSPNTFIENQVKAKLIDSPLGQIPEGWEVKVFSESFDFWNGKKCTKSEQGEFNLYGANGIVGKADEWKYENAVIIGRVGAYCGAVEYCFDRFWGSDNTIIAKCKTDTNISYLFLLLEHFNLNKYAGGSAQPLLTQTTLKQLKYIAPPEELINEFEKITHKFYEGVVNLKKRNQNLKKQRDMLLPKLISGQIELKD